MKLAGKLGRLLKNAQVHRKVVELHERVAHFLVCVLEALDSPLQRLDGTLLPAAVGTLCQPDLCSSSLREVRDITAWCIIANEP